MIRALIVFFALYLLAAAAILIFGSGLQWLDVGVLVILVMLALTVLVVRFAESPPPLPPAPPLARGASGPFIPYPRVSWGRSAAPGSERQAASLEGEHDTRDLLLGVGLVLVIFAIPLLPGFGQALGLSGPPLPWPSAFRGWLLTPAPWNTFGVFLVVAIAGLAFAAGRLGLYAGILLGAGAAIPCLVWLSLYQPYGYPLTPPVDVVWQALGSATFTRIDDQSISPTTPRPFAFIGVRAADVAVTNPLSRPPAGPSQLTVQGAIRDNIPLDHAWLRVNVLDSAGHVLGSEASCLTVTEAHPSGVNMTFAEFVQFRASSSPGEVASVQFEVWELQWPFPGPWACHSRLLWPFMT